jgi:hypothetical protein
MGRTAFLILTVGCSLSLFAFSYEGPRQVARFGETEPNGLGFIREGAGHGPLRLLASDTAIYLLSRLDHRLYTFDLTGMVLDSLDFDFCPADVTYDDEGRFHLLQSRVEPEFVAVYENRAEVERREFDPPENRLVNEMCFSPEGEVLLLSGGFTYRLVPTETKDILYAAGERPGRFHLTDTHIGRVVDSWKAEFTGETSRGPLASFRLEPLDRELFQFHTDDRLGRVYIVGTSIQTDEEGQSYIARRLLVYKEDKLLTELRGIAPGHSSYDYANHDIAVAPNGDIYLWMTHFSDGYSEILYFKAIPYP